MSNIDRIKKLASEYTEHFDFDFGDAGMTLILGEEAPDELKEIIREVCGEITDEALVQVYETLTTLSECEDIFLCEVDEKVCPLTLFCKITNKIESLVS